MPERRRSTLPREELERMYCLDLLQAIILAGSYRGALLAIDVIAERFSYGGPPPAVLETPAGRDLEAVSRALSEEIRGTVEAALKEASHALKLLLAEFSRNRCHEKIRLEE